MLFKCVADTQITSNVVRGLVGLSEFGLRCLLMSAQIQKCRKKAVGLKRAK